MISLVVFMSTAHQILVGAATSLLVAGAVGYGSINYYAGGLQKQVDHNAAELGEIKSLSNRSSGLESRVTVLENQLDSIGKRLDSFERIVVDNQKESQAIAYKILGEVAAMRKDTAINSTKIGAIEVDISEIKEKVK